MTEVCMLPSGYTLFVKDNEAGGRTYYSDEVGCGVIVWDTVLVNEDTLLAAILEEKRAAMKECGRKFNHEKLTSC